MELRGERVLLRPLRREDAAELRALVSRDREAYPYMAVPLPEEVDGWLTDVLAQTARRAALAFATCLPSGELVGSTRLFDLQRWTFPYGRDPRAGQDVLDACEIGHTFLAPRAQRTGVNVEAKVLMLRHAFEVWKVWRVTVKTDARNDQSRAAIEKLGARLDGVLRAFQPATDGRPRDTAYYTILADEWPRVQALLRARLAR